MGVFDKIKNALFEEEYVEVEEKPKKVKKVKPKETEVVEKPIAKKIVLPEKKETRIEELEEEELLDEDFEIQPKKDVSRHREEEKHNEFKIMDEDDFCVDEEEYRPTSQPKIIKTENDDRYRNERVVSRDEPRYYQGKTEEKEKQPYGIDGSSKIHMPDYGSGVYEKKEDRTHFRPSPIISPIYGILDKNYKKEDVVQKKEVRLTSSYSRGKLSVDDVRNKAYGTLSDDIAKDIEEPVLESSFEIDDDNLLVDLTADDDKPSVKEVTMGDALEYFQDLGLEYNVDYVDATKEKATGRRAKEYYEELEEEKEEVKVDNDSIVKEKVKVEIKKEQEITKVVKEDKEPEVKVEKKEEKTTDVDLDSDDNLFDLIDSMYQENN